MVHAVGDHEFSVIYALWEQSLAEVDWAAITADMARAEAAAAEPSFSGFLRRCLRHGGRPISLFASIAQVDPTRLPRFLLSEAPLDSSEIDRLLSTLGVELLACGKT